MPIKKMREQKELVDKEKKSVFKRISKEKMKKREKNELATCKQE